LVTRSIVRKGETIGMVGISWGVYLIRGRL
jgi:hypothetical protein